MRFFSPFAVLGLLHVARGGELDAFAGDRARQIRDGLTSGPISFVERSNPTDAPNVFKRALQRREQNERALDSLDANKDGHIDHGEIIKALGVHWKGEDNARRMLRAFGAPDLESFMKRSSPEDDGRVPKEKLEEILETRPLENPEYCPAIRTKVESCPTHAVLKCGTYLNAAESFCNTGTPNLIEKCIMSESCDNMCSCIAAVEDAAHGDGAIVSDGQLVQVALNSVGLPERGLHSRQFGEELLGLLIWAIIEFIIGITASYIIGNIYESLTSANPWMDASSWDGSGLEPACTSYVYWGKCGAIGSSKARNCPNGGQRVFGNSCKDHFRYGSQGCGFWDLGCQSLCSKVNPKGCPCSLFDWSEFDGQDMPGSDMAKGSFFTTKVSTCRNACTGNSTCKAFVMAPFSGNEKDKRPNCFLKTAQRQTQTVKGSTVFFKRGKNGDLCGGVPTIVNGVPFDDDWTSSATVNRRGISGTGYRLAARAKGDEVPFPFDRSRSGYLFLGAVSIIYQGLTSEFTWENFPSVRPPIGDTQAVTGPGGGNTGRPSDAFYLSYRPMPQWRPTEIAFRVNTMFREIITTAVDPGNVDDPVVAWLSRNVPGTAGSTSSWPASVRALLRANSAIVHNIGRGNEDTWIGRRLALNGGILPPYAGVQAGYDQSMGFYQRGGVGPFSLEAAFLYATQIAGVNFRSVARGYQGSQAGWWMGVMTNGRDDRACLIESIEDNTSYRVYGRFESVAGNTRHDQRNGVYMVYDFDPTLAIDDPNHNVFVFAVHVMDANSLVGATEAQLRAVDLGNADHYYTPASNSSSARAYNSGSSAANVTPPTANSGTRMMAHAHAAVITRQQLENYLNAPTTVGFPGYSQLSYSHIYILTEDVSFGPNDNPADWPRRDWQNNGGGSSGSK